jgi:hypothetical protein
MNIENICFKFHNDDGNLHNFASNIRKKIFRPLLTKVMATLLNLSIQLLRNVSGSGCAQ